MAHGASSNPPTRRGRRREIDVGDSEVIMVLCLSIADQVLIVPISIRAVVVLDIDIRTGV